MRMPATVHSIGELPKPNAKQDTVPLEHHEAMIAALKAHIAHLQANIAAANKQTDQWRELVDHYWPALIAKREDDNSSWTKPPAPKPRAVTLRSPPAKTWLPNS